MKTPICKSEVDALRAEYPDLPEDYFRYLLAVGSGKAASGRMIYSGPINPSDIYGTSLHDSHIVLLGDDMQGYCLGFDRSSLQFGEMSNRGEWEPWPPKLTFARYTGDCETQDPS